MRPGNDRHRMNRATQMALGLSLFLGMALAADALQNNKAMQSPQSRPPRHTVHFGFGDDQVDPAERGFLENFVRSIGNDKSLALSGYTDDIGPVAYNNALALRRAESVRAVLIGTGFPADKITVQGRGRTDYVATNESKRERAKNRRVEIRYQDQGAIVGEEDQQSASNGPRRMGRYSMRSLVPLEGQKDPLDAVVQVTIPSAIQDVGSALAHLLAHSGWRLAAPPSVDPSLTELLRLPLPESQRTLGPLRLHEAVQVLCGDAYRVVVDPVHRLISCELRDPYAKYWTDSNVVVSFQ